MLSEISDESGVKDAAEEFTQVAVNTDAPVVTGVILVSIFKYRRDETFIPNTGVVSSGQHQVEVFLHGELEF